MADLHALHPRGGLYFEDFEVGRVFRHRLTRTVSQMDNLLFSSLTLNPQPLHIDAHFCATETEWGRPLMNSLFTLGLLIGIRSTTRRSGRPSPISA
jgi:acyl dehydratase